jgi:transcriptional antiterminator NusG
MSNEDSKWYAIHTRSHFEQKVYEGLCAKSIDSFLPRVQVMSQRKDRRKKIFIPMLPGYIFFHSNLDPEEYHQVLKTVGVVRIVGFKGKAVPANDQEIASLMILDGTDRTVANRGYMNKGDRVMIMEGPLKGLVGYYLRHRAQTEKVVVSVELLQRSLEVEIEGWSLEKVV